MFKRIIPFLLVISLTVAGLPGPARAAGLSIVRDAEVESTIRAFAAPVFKAAGLDPNSIRVHLVNDPAINAFVADGLNLFINTGLILRTTNPLEVIGVIAHETGHIAGGHLARGAEEMRRTSTEAMIAMALGAAAGLAAGRPDVGIAAATGGANVAARSYLGYRRTQEASADAAAVTFMNKAHISPRGLLQFLKVMEGEEFLQSDKMDPYLVDHPLTPERIDNLEQRVDTSPYLNAPVPPDFLEMYQRMMAKLFAFLNPPMVTLRKYKADDTSIAARYARAIAYYRIPDLNKALPLIDGLIAERPHDPYFRELKGQMLFENGRVAEAVAPYQEAVRLDPGSGLIQTELGQVEVETGDPKLLDDAVNHLTIASQRDANTSLTWHLLAVALGRKGDMGNAALALAEEAVLAGNRREAVGQANRALKLLPSGSRGWLRAQDIRALAAQAGDR